LSGRIRVYYSIIQRIVMTINNKNMTISFAISEWSGWQSTFSDESADALSDVTISEVPDVAMIPPMLRRRLNLLGRACASEMIKHLKDGDNIPIVYCSQHGDIERTLNVLSELVDDQPVSPMHFSLAVHNAICGVLSIQAGLTANISTIAAGQQGLVPVFLEAAGILMGGADKVLCVICDVLLPEIYRDEQSLPKIPYAISFVMTRSNGVNLTLQQLPLNEDMSHVNLSPTSLIEFLATKQTELLIEHNSVTWALSRD